MNRGEQPTSIEPEKLRPILHNKIESMNQDQLSLLNRVLLQIEAEELAGRLSTAFEQDQSEGKLQHVAELVRQFRSGHPYR